MNNLPWDNTEERWLELGVLDEDPHVLELPGYESASRYAGVVLLGDSYVQCRVATPGPGVFDSPKKGDQVLVFFPGGRPNSGIVLGALRSDAVPFPVGGDTEKTAVINPRGFKVLITNVVGSEPAEGDATFVLDSGHFAAFLLSAASDPDAVLRSTQFLTDLKNTLTEILGLFTALSIPATLTSAMITNITTSLSPVNLPYRSRNVKVD